MSEQNKEHAPATQVPITEVVANHKPYETRQLYRSDIVGGLAKDACEFADRVARRSNDPFEGIRFAPPVKRDTE